MFYVNQCQTNNIEALKEELSTLEASSIRVSLHLVTSCHLESQMSIQTEIIIIESLLL